MSFLGSFISFSLVMIVWCVMLVHEVDLLKVRLDNAEWRMTDHLRDCSPMKDPHQP